MVREPKSFIIGYGNTVLSLVYKLANRDKGKEEKWEGQLSMFIMLEIL